MHVTVVNPCLCMASAYDLSCVLKFVKIFVLKFFLAVPRPEHRYGEAYESSSLNDVMSHLLPLIHQMCTELMVDQSEMAVTIQKQILKIFFALIDVKHCL